MWYFVIFIVLIVISFFIFYPFKVKVYNLNNYLFINIGGIINIKINLLSLFENLNKDSINEQKEGLKIIKKLKFKEVDLKIVGLNFDYRLNGGYFGLLYALFATIDNILLTRGVLFNYELSYKGDKSIEFFAIMRARMSNVIKVVGK